MASATQHTERVDHFSKSAVEERLAAYLGWHTATAPTTASSAATSVVPDKPESTIKSGRHNKDAFAKTTQKSTISLGAPAKKLPVPATTQGPAELVQQTPHNRTKAGLVPGITSRSAPQARLIIPPEQGRKGARPMLAAEPPAPKKSPHLVTPRKETMAEKMPGLRNLNTADFEQIAEIVIKACQEGKITVANKPAALLAIEIREQVKAAAIEQDASIQCYYLLSRPLLASGISDFKAIGMIVYQTLKDKLSGTQTTTA